MVQPRRASRLAEMALLGAQVAAGTEFQWKECFPT